MSDMEDDFMCDDEEDYDLVFITKITLFILNFNRLFAGLGNGLANVSCLVSSLAITKLTAEA